ncbi:MAG: gamma-glutamyltransferase [Phycisphaerales bacterium JB040]
MVGCRAGDGVRPRWTPGDPAWSREYASYAVAADHETASRAGAEILARGGNAVDAAVATSFTLSVVRPFSCGIGGGGFLVVHRPPGDGRDGVSEAFNYRETTPRGVGPAYYTHEVGDRYRPSLRGGTAAGVPGTVAGLHAAHSAHGSLAWAELLAPAIRAAEDGFVVDEAYLSTARGLIDEYERRPELKERFAFVWERFLRRGEVRLGDVIRNPEQARALRLIAERGATAFYEGEIADAIAETVRADGGAMTAEDLRSYEARRVRPLEFRSGDRRVLTMPPPSSGGVALAQLDGVYRRLLDRFPGADSDTALRAHLYVEASKHAFSDRAEFLADPDFVDVPVARMIADETLDRYASSVLADRTLEPRAYGGIGPFADDSGTSHFSIVDADGMGVACTETINTGFGSQLAVAEFGFVLNNEMDDFTTTPGEANAYGLVQSDSNLPEPGKRPLSSMTPTIVLDEDGGIRLVTGASGGPRIISIVAQTVLEPGVLGHAHSLANPTLHHQWLPDTIRVEHGVGGRVRAGLRARGHELVDTGGNAVAQTVRRVPRGSGWVWRAESDPRKGGVPAGR